MTTILQYYMPYYKNHSRPFIVHVDRGDIHLAPPTLYSYGLIDSLTVYIR